MRILGIDGRSGSGKSTLGEYLGDRYRLPVVQLDQLCPGWDGLEAGMDRAIEWILAPAREAPAAPGRIGYRRWDWYADEYAEWVAIPEAPVLIVEGCGIGARRAREYLDGLVWVQTPDDLRRRRALERERGFAGAHAVDPLWWWERWGRQEEAVLRREQTPLHATWRLDGRRLGCDTRPR